MSTKLTIALILLNVITMLFIYYNVKKKKIILKYALIWFIASVILVFCALTPTLMESLANFIGFEKASNMIFLFVVGINIIITFILTTIVSNQKDKITTLIQELGIVKEQLNNDK